MMQFEREREAAQRIQNHEKEVARLRRRLGEVGSNAQSEKQKMKNMFEAQLRDLQRVANGFEGERDSARGERDSARNDRDSARLLCGLQKSEIARLERDKLELKDQVKARDNAIQQLKEEKVASEGVKEKLQNAEAKLKKESDEHEKALQQADAELSRKSEEIESLQAQVAASHNLEGDLDSTNAQVASLQQLVAETEARAQTNIRDSEAYQNLLSKFNIIKTEFNALTEKHKWLQGQLDAATKSRAAEKTKLERENANLKNQVKVMKENKQGEKGDKMKEK